MTFLSKAYHDPCFVRRGGGKTKSNYSDAGCWSSDDFLEEANYQKWLPAISPELLL